MENSTKICPFCGEEIKITAKKCKYCGEFLEIENKNQKQIIECPFCGGDVSEGDSICRHCKEKLIENTKTSNYPDKHKKEMPIGLKKFNWGAFLSSWIWGIFNKSYIPFWIFAVCILCIIPIIGQIALIAFCIYCGIKGNEWAWCNKEWKSIEHFNQVQKKWAMWSGIAFGASILLALFITIICAIIAAIMSWGNGSY